MVRGQPPSGGCVLKQTMEWPVGCIINPAAFRRLCVETGERCEYIQPVVPAAFRRLCVETFSVAPAGYLPMPAAFRRLCVETQIRWLVFAESETSRLQAAVC